MRLRTRNPRRVAIAGLALVTAAALTACTSDDEGNGDASGDAQTTTTVNESAPQAPLDQLVLSEGEAPGGGVVQVIEPALLQEAVDKLVADQGKQLMEDPACDRVSRLETVSNFATTDGLTAAVRYKQSEEDETEHRFGIGMVGEKLDDFMDRSLYEACTSSRSTTNPDVELVMTVEDAPALEGVEGFRVTSDFITTRPDGTRSLSRAIAIHGYTRETTVSVEYAARGNDPAADPVLPSADGALDAIYQAQMAKIATAE
ncbi:hypothetical protein H483_0113045 [Dietzia sp. UCD-THP]|uniref:Sensor domain-containing protein n=1 Tax=Dietzia natronolimnaea TaxID=161920 RepID=A0A2A2WT94_9ACTN|nr:MULTISPECIES: hypothetical protein [Dietzia]EYT61076.1 hypothetical protein H483_0113045 [Dietzia sp. UCD-THP]PAY24204.1 hypothetical protein CEY15_04210 [Dietzia natronolimnaea]